MTSIDDNVIQRKHKQTLQILTPNSKRRTNKVTSMKSSLPHEYKLSISPKLQKHPSARNLIESMLKNDNAFYSIDIDVSNQTSNTIPIQPINSYHVEINQIEGKLYSSKTDVFWLKNNDNGNGNSEHSGNEKDNREKERGIGRNTNKIDSMTEFQHNLDKILTEAIRANKTYDEIEKAFEGCLKGDKKNCCGSNE